MAHGNYKKLNHQEISFMSGITMLFTLILHQYLLIIKCRDKIFKPLHASLYSCHLLASGCESAVVA